MGVPGPPVQDRTAGGRRFLHIIIPPGEPRSSIAPHHGSFRPFRHLHLFYIEKEPSLQTGMEILFYPVHFRLETELDLDVSDVTTDLVKLIGKMEPFGMGMPQPLVRVHGILDEIRAVGADGKTLRMRIEGRGAAPGRRYPARITAVAFRRSQLADYYTGGMAVMAAGSLSIDSYQGHEYPQIIAQDLHLDLDERLRDIMFYFSLRRVDPSYERYCLTKESLEPSVCASSYRMLREISGRQGSPGRGHISLEDYTGARGEKGEEALYRLLQSLCVFEELGLAGLECSGPYLSFELVPGKKALLADSAWYRRFFA